MEPSLTFAQALNIMYWLNWGEHVLAMWGFIALFISARDQF